jgi:hypothetical protein
MPNFCWWTGSIRNFLPRLALTLYLPNLSTSQIARIAGVNYHTLLDLIFMPVIFHINRLLQQEIILGKIRYFYSENVSNIFLSRKQPKTV